VVAMHGLMGNISNGMQLQEAFLHAVGEGKSYVMLWILAAYCTGCATWNPCLLACIRAHDYMTCHSAHSQWWCSHVLGPEKLLVSMSCNRTCLMYFPYIICHM
jgi:hypothetical protein